MRWKLSRWLKPKPPVQEKAKAIIFRKSESDAGTFGVMHADGFWCHTLELPDRGNKSNMSRIPPGRYKVSIRKSRKYGDVYHVKDVKDRTFILIHSGNFAGDVIKGLLSHSAGCLLLGKYKGVLQTKGRPQAAVLSSRPAVRNFVEKMGKSPFILEITGG